MSDPASDTADGRFATIRTLTNKRQAAKVCDVSSAAAMVLEKPDNRTEYVRGLANGLYAVGIGSGGGLYMARYLSPPQVTMLAKRAEIDVVHDRDRLPAAVREADR